MATSIQQAPAENPANRNCPQTPGEAQRRPADDFTVEWCLPTLWCKTGGADSSMTRPSGDNGDMLYSFTVE